jgi:hypothetical protein
MDVEILKMYHDHAHDIFTSEYLLDSFAKNNCMDYDIKSIYKQTNTCPSQNLALFGRVSQVLIMISDKRFNGLILIQSQVVIVLSR